MQSDGLRSTRNMLTYWQTLAKKNKRQICWQALRVGSRDDVSLRDKSTASQGAGPLTHIEKLSLEYSRIMNLAITRIRSGGQSGVDRAALDFGRKHNIEICGWCPKGGWAEDYLDAPGQQSADT